MADDDLRSRWATHSEEVKATTFHTSERRCSAGAREDVLGAGNTAEDPLWRSLATSNEQCPYKRITLSVTRMRKI